MVPGEVRPVNADKPLPRWTKAGYGAAELGASAAEVILQIYLLFFYTNVVGLRAEYAGYALALAVFWDAVTDPIMGFISDRTRTRFGRRSPYIAAGSLALAAAFLALFLPPPMESQFAKFLYLLLCYMAVNSAMTLIAVPHAALGGDLSFDRNERTELFGWRMLFRYLGFLAAVVLLGMNSAGAVKGATAADAPARMFPAILAIGILIILFCGLTILAVRGRDHAALLPHGLEQGLPARMRAFILANYHALRNPYFLPLLAAFVIAQAGRTINASLALPYYTLRVELEESQVLLGILVPFMFVASPSIVVWVLLARRFGKKYPAFAGAFLLGLETVFLYPLVPHGSLWIPVLFAAGIGGFLISSAVLFDSLVADVVDYDELKTGLQREGLYFGCWMLSTKVARALGLAATGQMLRFIGYQEGAAMQTAEVGSRLALLFGPVVGTCFVLAALVFLLMPLTRERHARIQTLLIRRRAWRATQTARH